MLKLKPYRQKPCFCGPASLKMVLGYYGVQKTEDQLGRIAKTTVEDGTRGRRILNAARKLGFHGFMRDHCGIDDLKRWVVDKRVPVIVNWFSTDEGHYSVCVHVTDEKVYLMDPEIAGIKEFDHDTFLNVWFDFLHLHERTKDSLVLRRMIAVYPESWIKKS